MIYIPNCQKTKRFLYNIKSLLHSRPKRPKIVLICVRCDNGYELERRKVFMRKMWGLRFISALLIAVLLLSELKVTAFAGEVEIVEEEAEIIDVVGDTSIDESVIEIEQIDQEIGFEEDKQEEFNEYILSSSGYSPSYAVSYALNNWNRSSELCAGFVCNCLHAGGLTDFPFSRLANCCDTGNLVSFGFAKNYLEYTGKTSIRSDGSNSGKVAVGDVIVYRCFNGCNTYLHVALVTEISNGIVYTTDTNGQSAMLNTAKVQAGWYIDMAGHGYGNAMLTIECFHYVGNAPSHKTACDYPKDNTVINGHNVYVQGWADRNNLSSVKIFVDGNETNTLTVANGGIYERDDVRSYAKGFSAYVNTDGLCLNEHTVNIKAYYSNGDVVDVGTRKIFKPFVFIDNGVGGSRGWVNDNNACLYNVMYVASSYMNDLSVGVRVGTSAGNWNVVNHIEGMSAAGYNQLYPTGYVEVWYDLVNELKAVSLNSGTNYYYEFYAKRGGVEYAGPSGSFRTTGAADTTAPVISDVKITDVSPSGYTVVCTATDNRSVDRVMFPTWTLLNGQDDMSANWSTNSKYKGSKNGNVYSYRVNISDHKNELGSYRTEIYAFDAAGNYSGKSINQYLENEKPIVISAEITSYDSEGYDVTATAVDNIGVTKIKFPTWAKGYDEKDIIWYEGTPVVNGTSTCRINAEDFNLIDGSMTTDVRAYDASGNISDYYRLSIKLENCLISADVPETGIPEGIWINPIEDQIYTGSVIKPQLRVYSGKKRLVEGSDYTVSIKNNVKANDATDSKIAPTVTVTGKGNYSGSDTATFKILKRDISEEGFYADNVSIIVNNKPQKPTTNLLYNNKTLKKGADFDIEYYDVTGSNKIDAITTAGTYKLKFVGKNNYCGEKSVIITASDKATLVSKLTVVKIPNQQYNGGNPITPAIIVKNGKEILTEGPLADYTLSYEDNKEVGTAYVIISGTGKAGGYIGTKKVKFNIVGTGISKATVDGIPQKLGYSGMEHTFTFGDIADSSLNKVKVYFKATKTTPEKLLEYGKDYSVEYKNNIKSGTATVTIYGEGGYTGSIKKTFKIDKYDISKNLSGQIICEVNNSCEYSKGGAKPQASLSLITSSGSLQSLREGIDYSIAYKNNNAVNDCSNSKKLPKAIIKGKGNFCGTIERTFAITVKPIDTLTVVCKDKTYQKKSNAYATTISIVDSDGKVLNAGKDYEKTPVYSYASDVEVTIGKNNETIQRKAGDIVEKNDVIPCGTRINVLLIGKGNYTGSTVGSYRITKSMINSAKVTVPKQVYSGKEIIINDEDITVKVGKEVLTPYNKSTNDGDFVIRENSFSNNVNKGTGSFIIDGCGNYGGSLTVKFSIGARSVLWWWR